MSEPAKPPNVLGQPPWMLVVLLLPVLGQVLLEFIANTRLLVGVCGSALIFYLWTCNRGEKAERGGATEPVQEFRGVNYGGRFIYEPLFSEAIARNVLFTEAEKQRIVQLLKAAAKEAAAEVRGDGVLQGLVEDGVSQADLGAKEACPSGLCKFIVGDTADAAEHAAEVKRRVISFLDAAIKEEHFEDMAAKGFNTVRLPLGWWNLLDEEQLPADVTPAGPDTVWSLGVAQRWRDGLKKPMSARDYRAYIDMVFHFASKHGLKVLLDFHGAPGGQCANGNVGTNLGGATGKLFYFDGTQEWNTELGIRCLETLADICVAHWDSCYGIELLNEPAVHFIPRKADGTSVRNIDRKLLHENFYRPAIKRIRTRMKNAMAKAAPAATDVETRVLAKPLIIQDWIDHMEDYWVKHVRDYYTSSSTQNIDTDVGVIIFSTHVYLSGDPKSRSLDHYMEQGGQAGMDQLENFAERWKRLTRSRRPGLAKRPNSSGVPQFMITEFGVNGMDAMPHADRTEFIYRVHYDIVLFWGGLGTAIWNYDGWGGWGPVRNRFADFFA